MPDSGGDTLGDTEVLHDPREVKEHFLEMVRSSKSEVLLLLPSSQAYHREERIGVIGLLEEAARRGLSVRVISATDPEVIRSVAMMKSRLLAEGHAAVQFMEAEPMPTPRTVTVLVTDKRASLVIEQVSAAEEEFTKAIGTAVISTSEPTVKASESSFDLVWQELDMIKREQALLERERRSKRQAEVLQDILAHDLRNYNQIIRTNAELLRDDLGEASGGAIEAIIKATDGSSILAEKASRLSRILGEDEYRLAPFQLEDSIRRALVLTSSSNPYKSVSLVSPLSTRSTVMADELLDEVFVNILSNSIRYTPSPEVRLEISVDAKIASSGEDDSPTPFVRVSLSDHGKGIPPSMKPWIFTRYQTSASGTGLGLSIVHALVVDRYGGKLSVIDRVPGEYKSGTKVEVLLRPAPPEPTIAP